VAQGVQRKREKRRWKMITGVGGHSQAEQKKIILTEEKKNIK